MTLPFAVTQDEINKILWKACDTFRGTIDPSEYKDYILVMLFLKYISDTWLEHYEELKAQYGDDPELLQRKLERERFFLPEGKSYYDLYSQRDRENLGELINTALDAIEEKNKKLEGVFRNIDFNSESKLGQTRERNVRLKNLLQDFADPRLDLRPSRIGNMDVIGNAYEYLISNFAAGAGKKAGEFYTPAEVSELLAELMHPQPGERIYDPTCGSGSLLIKTGNQLIQKGIKDFSLYGQDINGSTWALSKMNMFLHGLDSARIEWGDTIRNPKHLADEKTLMRFDVVVANPPFSLDKWGAEDAASDEFRRFHRGVPPKSKGDYAFISHIIESLNPQKGRAGIVVPHGVLFRGSSEGTIRQKLIEENLLDAVIGLPSNLFFGTGIPAAVLVFRQGKTDTNTLFIDASRAYQEGKNQNKLRDTDIHKIVETYLNRTEIEKYSKLASLQDIRENDYNLNIPRYVDTFEEEEEIDVAAVQQEIEQLEQELQETRVKMQGYLRELGLV
ncbi:type I restriction-modification system subunit M [Deinococcus roseus]|uniref:site-specific DNA-methyltransferase (adenine-specific) n=1 Tax=Deinococcus roseus TaxID=392414 RepID=A0ABQ2CYM5_9DEIO|nr:type I restriction-modification system subunit M [Deinococcus roseus]GGJ27261.1 type I restriction-modification system subunit M [Deinococcus roseus]